MRVFVVCVLAVAAVAAVHAQELPALSENEVLPGQRIGAWESDRPINETALKLGWPSTVYGVDISQGVSTSDFACLKAAGLTFAIMRAWRSYGAPDPNAPGTVAAAWAAGIAHVDVYMFPCYSCGNPSGQVQQLISFLSGHGTRYGMIWLDIEGAGTYWSSNQVANRAFFEALRNEVVAQGKSLGIYSSASQWNPIFGSSYTGGSAYPLWYAHYDGQPSFGDFQPFGGWSHPNMKQFSDQGSKCGTSYDINWYPA